MRESGTGSDQNVFYPSWVERNGFSHWIVAVLWTGIAFFIFQAVASVVAISLIILNEGLDPNVDLTRVMTERLDLLFIGNSVGQILFLGLASWLVAGLHTGGESRNRYLRLTTRSDTVNLTLLTALLFVVVQPTIWYIGYLNSLLPIPDYFTELQDAQQEMIENFLQSDGAVLMGLLNIALVPAICEEVMFRGYVQRSLERSWGVWAAILVSGFLFGLFHLQMTNILPLSTLGILLALVTWLSGSLIPAMVAHFVNNGSAVVLGNMWPEMAFAEMTAEAAPPLWSLGISLVVSYLIIRQLFVQCEIQS